MMPINFVHYRAEIKESIVFLLAAQNAVFPCDMEEILNITNPVMIIEISNSQATTAKIVNDNDLHKFNYLIENTKKAAV